MKRRTKKLLFLLSPFFIVMIALHACMTFRMSPKKIDGYFAEHRVAVVQEKYEHEGRDMHFICTGDEQKPLILFVHGSPGSLSDFIGFLADSVLLEKHLLISTDRPGFGYSNFGYGEPSINKQAEILISVVEKFRANKPVILVGHSLGVPVVAQMAINHPDLIDGLVFVAGSIDPDLEPNEAWFRIPLSTPFLNWILPRSFRASNDELYNFKHELTMMLPHWSDIKAPVVFIQGKKDILVDPGNAEFARRSIINAPLEIIYKDDMNHFVPWSDPDLIVNGIGLVEEMISHSKLSATP